MKKIIRKIKDWYLICIARRISEKHCLRLIIDYELHKYKVNMEYVFANVKIEGEDWWMYYSFDSDEEYLNWKNFSTKILRKTYRYSDEININRTFLLIDLMYGLTRTYDRESKNN